MVALALNIVYNKISFQIRNLIMKAVATSSILFCWHSSTDWFQSVSNAGIHMMENFVMENTQSRV